MMAHMLRFMHQRLRDIVIMQGGIEDNFGGDIDIFAVFDAVDGQGGSRFGLCVFFKTDGDFFVVQEGDHVITFGHGSQTRQNIVQADGMRPVQPFFALLRGHICRFPVL